MELVKSGLPIFMNQETGELNFFEGLEYQNRNEKQACEMRIVFPNEDIPEEEIVYEVYRGISYPEHKEIFQETDIRYDITVIHGGTVGEECKKTSGHYHGYTETKDFTYPEVYEVLKGKSIFLLQKSILPIDGTKGEETKIEEIYAVHAEEGDVVIIPPFYGHCSVNPTEEFAVFSNVAVTSCPMNYEIIQQKHGLAVRVKKKGESVTFMNNTEYPAVPSIKHIKVDRNSPLKIGAEVPCYMDFVLNPEKYEFLRCPEKFIEQMKIK